MAEIRRASVSNSSDPRPDYGLYVGLLFGIASIFFFVLQSNGVEVNWITSAIIYAVCTVGVVWTTLRHALPHRGKGRYAAVAGLVMVCVAVGSIGTFKQYRKEHPRDNAAAPAPYDPNRGTRLAVSLGPVGITGKSVPVTEAALILQNMGDVVDQHVYIHMFTPTSIRSIKIDSPARVQVVNGGPGSTGPGGDKGLELSVPELLPHESRIIRVALAPMSLGDISISLSSDRCGKDCRSGIGIVRAEIGTVQDASETGQSKPMRDIPKAKPDAGTMPTATTTPRPTTPKQQTCEVGSICNQDSPVQAPQTVNNFKDPPPRILGFSQEYLPPVPPFTVPYNAPGRDMLASQYNASLGFERANKMMTSAPGLKLTFHVSTPFPTPDFSISCDHPCAVSSESFTAFGGNTFSATNQVPAILTPGVGVVITVRSTDRDNPATSATVVPYVAPPAQ